jgi:hypothetical protein
MSRQSDAVPFGKLVSHADPPPSGKLVSHASLAASGKLVSHASPAAPLHGAEGGRRDELDL